MSKKVKQNDQLSKVLSKPRKKMTVNTVQESIQMHAVHALEGIIETYPTCFTKMYVLSDINYQTATEEDQTNMYLKYKTFVNSIGNNSECAISIYNRNINMDQFASETLYKEVGDKLDLQRREMNQINLDRIKEGKNSIKKDKYITIAVHAETLKKAVLAFTSIDKEVKRNMAAVGSNADIVPVVERLEMLHDIYNMGDDGTFLTRTKVVDTNGRWQDVLSFDFDNLRSLGLTVQDVIAPSSITYHKDYLEIGDKFARTLQITDLPSTLSDEFLTDLTNVDFNMLATVIFKPINGGKANDLIMRNLSLIRTNIAKEQKAAIKGNYSTDMINPDLVNRQDEAQTLLDDVRNHDEHLFETTIVLCIFADNKDKLDEYTDTIMMQCRKTSVTIATLALIQEDGFNASLPLCYNTLPFARTLTSSAVASLMPFAVQDVMDKDGLIYSLNAVSKNLIKYDRLGTQNFNGFILGTPGSGKSFAAKTEMLNVLLKTNADVIVIDPESEYGSMATLLGGEIIKIAPGSPNHINPMDINDDYDEESNNPVLAKADFILKLCETIIKTPYGLNSVQETIIDRCISDLYSKYLSTPVKYRNPNDMPTLSDFKCVLAKQKEPEAREISLALGLYTDGSLNTFAHRTNVDAKNRFVVYDIKDVGDKLKPMAMLIVLDSIWDRICKNRKIGKNTWFYVDEIYLLFQNEVSATFLNMLFKRSRKYGGVPTGLTQNVEDLLESDTARKMLSNCNFVQMLNQAPSDRAQLRELLNLSTAQVDFITSAPKGQGLIFTGKSTVPYYSTFPKNNSIYRCLTSDMREIQAYQEEDRRAKLHAKKMERTQ